MAAYRRRAGSGSRAKTREAILGAVRSLLEEGRFAEASVEEIAERAGVSRATLYQHFRSRVGLIDAICETLEQNPELVEVFACLDIEDPVEGLHRLLTHATRFVASEESLHRHLYGLVEIDEGARDFVARQTEDRHKALTFLVGRLQSVGRLHPGISGEEAVAILLVLTSFDTFHQLHRVAGLPVQDVDKMLLKLAATVTA